MILIYILEFFPGKKFTFWNFSQGKSLHFGIFPEILKLFPGKRKRKVPKCKLFTGKKREKFQNVNFSQGKVPKCKLFSFTNWNFLFFQPCKIFPRPNSGDKKMKFYILELFLKSGEDFSLKLFFSKIFLK